MWNLILRNYFRRLWLRSKSRTCTSRWIKRLAKSTCDSKTSTWRSSSKLAPKINGSASLWWPQSVWSSSEFRSGICKMCKKLENGSSLISRSSKMGLKDHRLQNWCWSPHYTLLCGLAHWQASSVWLLGSTLWRTWRRFTNLKKRSEKWSKVCHQGNKFSCKIRCTQCCKRGRFSWQRTLQMWKR